MLFDTHTHVNTEDFTDDHKAVIARCLEADTWMVNVGTCITDSKRAIELAHAYEKGVYASVGVHPNDVGADIDFIQLEGLARDEKVVGIGEVGLDYYRTTDKEKQRLQAEVFARHIELARKVDKPLIVHCREAHHDLLHMLKKYAQGLAGVMHFFGGPGSWENARAYLDMGFYLSFSGVVTFANYSYADDVARLPLERMLIETDAPFATPVPYRGKRNEPANVRYVAERIAALRGISFEEVSEQTTRNARALFKIKSS